MAPPCGLISRNVAGPSTIQLSHTLLYKRQTDRWSIDDQLALSRVANEAGQFNGTCKGTESGLPPVTDGGECASYYSDVSVYCCGAVGGIIRDLSQPSQQDPNGGGQNVTSSGNATSSSVSGGGNGSASNMTEPACQTNNFKDMLLCYKYTAEEHCRSAITGPWGVCNTEGATKSAEQQGLQSQTNSASSSSSSSRTAKMVIVGTILSSALLLVAGESF